jgi:hypothetical protein
MVNKKLIVTIDVEVDKDFEWKVSKTFSFLSIDEMTNGYFKNLCVSFDVKPVLFISPEVMRNVDSVKKILDFKKETSCELAAHLHTEFQKCNWGEEHFFAGLSINEVQAELSYNEELNLLTSFTSEFEKIFGQRPISFRPGRYGISINTYNILAKLGYSYSSTITPGILWNFNNNNVVVDYRDKDCFPELINTPDGSILEIPITIKRKSVYINNRLLNKFFSYFLPIFFSDLWLRPSFFKLNTSALNHIFNSNLEYHVMMFHSNELVVGGSPYSIKYKNLKMVYKNIKFIFEYCNLNNIKSITFNEI